MSLQSATRSRWRSFSIRKKLLLGYGVLVLLTAAVGGWGIWVFSRTSTAFEVAVQQSLPAIDHLLELDRDMNAAVVAERTLLFMNQKTPAALEQAARHDELLARLRDRWARYTSIPASAEESALWPAFEASHKAWEEVSREVVRTIQRDTPEARRDAIDVSLSAAAARLEQVRDVLVDLIELRQQAARDHAAAEKAAAARTRSGIVVLVGLALVLAVGTAVVLARSISQRLRETADLLREIADGDGDLTRRLKVRGGDEIAELAESFNRFVRKLADIIARVRFIAMQVAGASQELSGASTHLAASSQEQAASLEETAASLEEITATVRQNADNARQAAELAASSRNAANDGGRIVATAVASMHGITQASQRIADIIGVIDSIAFQTNLLALNAAVEAARAGEQGRGFAVVAAEVRGLAQRSAGAAKEIRDLIQDSVAKVEEGTSQVQASGKNLEQIIELAKRVADIVENIATASHEQSSGIDQLNHGVTQMDRVTQSNAAQTEELSSTAQSLAEQAEELRALVARFTLPADGHGGAAAGPAAAALPHSAEPDAPRRLRAVG